MSAAGHAVLAPHTEGYGEVVAWLHHEAELLDGYRFAEWLELLSEDIAYRMPVRTTQFLTDGEGFHLDSEFFCDDFPTLATRVKRLETEFAWAETPPSRTRHFVSNVIVEDTGAEGLAVRSAFLVTRTRAELDYQMFTGVRHDRLVRVDGALKLRERVILVDQTVITATNLSVLF